MFAFGVCDTLAVCSNDTLRLGSGDSVDVLLGRGALGGSDTLAVCSDNML